MAELTLPMGRLVLAVSLALALLAGLGAAPALARDKRFVGSEVCRECHETQYVSYSKYSKKAKSFGSVAVLKRGLTPQELGKCYECHTTGFKQPGGFVSEAETPGMKNAGCEVCHGPGNLHAESQDAKDIKTKLTQRDCVSCHNEERVGAFRFRPLVFGGGH